MNKKNNLQTILIVLMVCVTVFISTNTYANAQVGGEPTTLENPTTDGAVITVDPVVDGGPGFIMVSPLDFRPYTPSVTWAYDGTDLYNPSTTIWGTYEAGLTLPHGATITKVTLFFYDNATADLSFLFAKTSVYGTFHRLDQFASSGALTEYQCISTPIGTEKVDNQNYSYYIEIILPSKASSNLKISNVRIDYAYTSNLPAVMR